MNVPLDYDDDDFWLRRPRRPWLMASVAAWALIPVWALMLGVAAWGDTLVAVIYAGAGLAVSVVLVAAIGVIDDLMAQRADLLREVGRVRSILQGGR